MWEIHHTLDKASNYGNMWNICENAAEESSDFILQPYSSASWANWGNQMSYSRGCVLNIFSAKIPGVQWLSG